MVQLDRRKGTVCDEDGVWDKFGVAPRSIPDWLALVGDSADGFPGLAGWGKRSASVVLAHYGNFDDVPDDVAAVGSGGPPGRAGRGQAGRPAGRASGTLAELFRDLATLRLDPRLLDSVDALRWQGPTAGFDDVCRRFRDPGAGRAGLAALVPPA